MRPVPQTSFKPSKPAATPVRFAPVGLLAVVLALLNVFDAIATLHRRSCGAEEWSPPARVVLGWSTTTFVVWKLWAVNVLAAFLAVTNARRGLVFLVGLYAAVCVLHVWLLGISPSM